MSFTVQESITHGRRLPIIFPTLVMMKIQIPFLASTTFPQESTIVWKHCVLLVVLSLHGTCFQNLNLLPTLWNSSHLSIQLLILVLPLSALTRPVLFSKLSPINLPSEIGCRQLTLLWTPITTKTTRRLTDFARNFATQLQKMVLAPIWLKRNGLPMGKWCTKGPLILRCVTKNLCFYL